jgi:hypothetical protein
VTELLAARAKKSADSGITLASVLDDIERACVMAESRGQSNVVLNAAGLRAKLGGLLVDKIEHVGAFDQCETAEDAVKMIMADFDDPRDVLELMDHMREIAVRLLGDRAELVPEAQTGGRRLVSD